MTLDERARYLGCLGLLADCSPYVPEELRARVADAFDDACRSVPGLRWRRVADRLGIDVAPSKDASPCR